MDNASLNQHLSQIATRWTLLAQAHGDLAEVGAAAQAALVERYQAAVYRYLLGSLRDPDAADELFQEFALKLVRGDFHRADAARGRFRDFVKTALINLVINYRKKLGRDRQAGPASPEPVAADPDPFTADEEFLSGWRKALLDCAWEALAAAQKPQGPPFYDVLRFRSEHGGLSSQELAEQLTAQLEPAQPFTDAGIRKILQRARELFADLLVDEVSRSLPDASPAEVEQEVIDLGFQAYCRTALERRRSV